MVGSEGREKGERERHRDRGLEKQGGERGELEKVTKKYSGHLMKRQAS